MNIVSIVGARPQFIKAAAVIRAIPAIGRPLLIHTGQHYDGNMSDIFFDELDIPQPDYHLGVGSGPHGAQTGAMLTRIEEVLTRLAPDRVVVYGDTNSTLAGALAAAKLCLPLAHVEAGLRSFNRTMPEEVNRVIADHLSSRLLCPSRAAADNLAKEGIVHGVTVVGDVMMDALVQATARSDTQSSILAQLHLTAGHYILATIHRAENTDSRERLSSIVSALASLTEPVVVPMHPRTRIALGAFGIRPDPIANVLAIEPVGYLDMLQLTKNARLVMTDSGGLQKEAYWLGVPCITLRDETEWVETVQAGWNMLTGARSREIVYAAQSFKPPANHPALYGDGHSAERIVQALI